MYELGWPAKFRFRKKNVKFREINSGTGLTKYRKDAIPFTPIVLCPLYTAHCLMPSAPLSTAYSIGRCTLFTAKSHAHCPLLTAHSPLLNVHCLSAVYCPLPTVQSQLPNPHCLLSIIYCPFFIAHCLVSTAHCPLSTAHLLCLPPSFLTRRLLV